MFVGWLFDGGRMSMEEDVMPMGQTGDALETLAVGRTSE